MSPVNFRTLPPNSPGLKATSGTFYAHVFENPNAGIVRNLYWSSSVQFAPVTCDSEVRTPLLTFEWLTIGARRFSGTYPASSAKHLGAEASLYVFEHHPVSDWRCTWTWDSESPDCIFAFDATVDDAGFDNPFGGLQISGNVRLVFGGFVVVPDNLERKPSGIHESAALLGEYFDIPTSGKDEGWRHVFKPGND